MIRRPPRSTLFPYNDALPIFSAMANGGKLLVPFVPTTPAEQNHRVKLRRQLDVSPENWRRMVPGMVGAVNYGSGKDRKSTRLNSSHSQISYAVFCLKKKKKKE